MIMADEKPTNVGKTYTMKRRTVIKKKELKRTIFLDGNTVPMNDCLLLSF